MVLALLPAGCLALLYVLLLPSHGNDTESAAEPWRRLALLRASLVCGVLMVASTEVLGLFHALTRPWVSAVWGVAAIGLAAAVIGRARRGQLRAGDLLPSARRADPAVLVCVAGCAVVAAVTAFIALVAAPNNWDSMTYHLARVMHWQQNRSVAFYPTSIERQLQLTPGGEYGILHLQLLSGRDQLDNLPQWLASTGSLFVVSLIAARLGATARGQALAALFCATLPMGILQSSSTQNDYLVAYWLACLVALVIRVDPASWTWALESGAAVGLATFTKATAYVFALPFLVWLAVRLARDAIQSPTAGAEGPGAARAERRWVARLLDRHQIGGAVVRLAAVVALAGVVAVGLNAAQFVRNQGLYGTPLGPDDEYLNAFFGGPQLASNVLRNSTLQISTPVGSVNRAMERAVGRVHEALGIDPSDRGTTFGLTRFSVRQTSNGEDTAGNPLHFAVLVTISAIGASRRYRRSPVAPFLGCLVTGFLLFSFLLRWQPWNSRLMLPLFVLGSAAAGVVFGALPRRLSAIALAVGLTLAATPWLAANRSRPIVASAVLQTSPSILHASRIDQYFAKRPQLKAPYESTAALLSAHHARRVGLVLQGDDWEYPLWILLGAGQQGTPRIEHTQVQNRSARLGDPGVRAFDAIVCANCQPAEQRRLEAEGFRPVQAGLLTVLFAGGPGSSAGP
jgi:Dolichyl-phosphate-mannose-protein mannosyltransferase